MGILGEGVLMDACALLFLFSFVPMLFTDAGVGKTRESLYSAPSSTHSSRLELTSTAQPKREYQRHGRRLNQVSLP